MKLDTQARQALAGGREDLARQALERKSGVQQQLQGLDGQVSQLEQQQEKLVENEKELSARIESFRSQKEVMKAQYSAAEAQVRIGEAATGIGGKMADAGAAIERARTKTEEMQARAGGDGRADRVRHARGLHAPTRRSSTASSSQMASQTQVDSELERMKAELGSGEKPALEALEGGAAAPPAATEEKTQS